MGESNWNELELALRDSLPELPPEEIVAEVTPWKRAMGHILTGLALTSVTLNVLCLQYLLPAIGTVLMLLGFRALRRENRAFAACSVLSALRTVFVFALLILNATIFPPDGRYAEAETCLTWVQLALQFALLLCFALALALVKRKAGTPDAPNSAWGLLVWYALVCVLALSHYNGMVIGAAMIAVYVCMLRSISALSSQVDALGYAIAAAPVRVSEGVLAKALALLLLTGIACGYLFGGRYPMRWTPAAENEHAAVEAMEEKLLGLGFPKDVLADLSAEEIVTCDGALRVVTQTDDLALNDGRKASETEEGTTYITTVYDDRELRVTGVAVELPGERWQVFHHFEWTVKPNCFGTESVQLWPASHLDGWRMIDEPTGRLLCERGGVTCTAPYYALGTERYTASNLLLGERVNTDLFGEFSLPRNGERCRGYVAYTIEKASDIDYILDSWINYTHQRSRLQYPVLSAKEHRKTVGWDTYAFITAQDALQF